MDGYRAGNRKNTTYGGTRRSVRTAPARLARAARFLAGIFSADKTVSAFRYALVAASFVFLLSVVAAMESGLVSLGTGVVICVSIGIGYLFLTRHMDEDGEEN